MKRKKHKKVKQEMVDKGKDEKMPKIKKKQRNILLKLFKEFTIRVVTGHSSSPL